MTVRLRLASDILEKEGDELSYMNINPEVNWPNIKRNGCHKSQVVT